jgi:hypothetical protein
MNNNFVTHNAIDWDYKSDYSDNENSNQIDLKQEENNKSIENFVEPRKNEIHVEHLIDNTYPVNSMKPSKYFKPNKNYSYKNKDYYDRTRNQIKSEYYGNQGSYGSHRNYNYTKKYYPDHQTQDYKISNRQWHNYDNYYSSENYANYTNYNECTRIKYKKNKKKVDIFEKALKKSTKICSEIISNENISTKEEKYIEVKHDELVLNENESLTEAKDDDHLDKEKFFTNYSNDSIKAEAETNITLNSTLMNNNEILSGLTIEKQFDFSIGPNKKQIVSNNYINYKGNKNFMGFVYEIPPFIPNFTNSYNMIINNNQNPVQNIPNVDNINTVNLDDLKRLVESLKSNKLN